MMGWSGTSPKIELFSAIFLYEKSDELEAQMENQAR